MGGRGDKGDSSGPRGGDEGAALGTGKIGIASPNGRRLFSSLAKAFIEDYMGKKLAMEASGWRTLVESARSAGLSRGVMYGNTGGFSPFVNDLIRRRLLEVRVFPGERGRGGRVSRVRVLYANEPVQDYVDRVVSGKKRPQGQVRVSGTPRIAILPFDNLSPDSADSYFADGVTEELITAISRIREVEVISRTSVMRYRSSPKPMDQVARELKVGTVLEGSVRKRGNTYRISVQMIDAVNDRHLWAENYDRELTDPFAIQSEVAERVADTLRIKLAAGERRGISERAKGNASAHLLYLKGRYYWGERSRPALDKAVAYLERAARDDPTYAPAHAGLADCFTVMVNYAFINPAEGLAKARRHALRALELDSDLPEAHGALGLVSMNLWHFEEAISELRIALRLNPSYASAHQWYGDCLWLMRGDFDGMLREKEKARELDPLSPVSNLNVGTAYLAARQLDRAVAEVRETLERFPGFWSAHIHMATILSIEKDLRGALAEVDKAAASSADELGVIMARAEVYGRLGRTRDARRQLRLLLILSRERYVPPQEIAGIYALMGNVEEAYTWLRRSVSERSPDLPWYLASMPEVQEALGADPRWKPISAAIGLTHRSTTRPFARGSPGTG